MASFAISLHECHSAPRRNQRGSTIAGIVDDTDSVMEMVGEAAKRLHAKDPEHELLGFLKGMDDEKVYAAFVERFGKKNIPEHQRSNAFNTAWMYAQYLVALRAALDETAATPPAPSKQETFPRHNDHDDVPIPF